MSKARNQQLRRYNEARKIKARASRVGRVYKASRTESAKLLPLPCIDLAGASVPAVLELLKLRHGARLLWVGCGGAVEAVAVALELGRIVASFELVEQQPAACEAARALLRRVGAVELESDELFSLRTRSGGEVRFRVSCSDIMELEVEELLIEAYTHVYSTALQPGPQLCLRLTQLAAGARLVMLNRMWIDAGMRVPAQRLGVETQGGSGFQMCAGRMPSAAERKASVKMAVEARFAIGCRGSGSIKGAWQEGRVTGVYPDGSVDVRYVDQRLGEERVLSQHWRKA